MFLSEKVTNRVKRACIGIAMGMAIWLLYASYLVLSNSINANTPMVSVGLTLMPVMVGSQSQK